jgi:hypothetical protein
MQMRISSVGRCIHLFSGGAFQRALAAREVEAAPGDFWTEESALSFFRQHFYGADTIGRLRSALAHEVHDMTRMRDDDVITAAAWRLHSGVWRIGYVPAPGPSAVAATAAGAPVPPIRRIISTSARQADAAPSRPPLMAPVRVARAPAPAAATTPAPAPEWPEDADQAAFAGVLEQAARSVTPFCEICAALAKNKAAIPA